MSVGGELSEPLSDGQTPGSELSGKLAPTGSTRERRKDNGQLRTEQRWQVRHARVFVELARPCAAQLLP
jgi:hypothetical protein